MLNLDLNKVLNKMLKCTLYYTLDDDMNLFQKGYKITKLGELKEVKAVSDCIVIKQKEGNTFILRENTFYELEI